MPAGAVDKAERDKREDTEEAAKAKGAVYLPFGATVDGGLGLTAIEVVSKVARKAAERFSLDLPFGFSRITFLLGYCLGISTCQMLEDQINFKKGHSFVF